jgi:hypothetical protein
MKLIDSRKTKLSWAIKFLLTHPYACKVVAAVIGGAVVSAGVGAAASSSAAGKEASAAENAANTTLEATQETNQLNWDIYMQNEANLSPQMQVQQEAESALASGLGLGTPNTGTNQMGMGTAATPTGPTSNTFQATATGTPAPMSSTNGITPSAQQQVTPQSTGSALGGSGIPVSGARVMGPNPMSTIASPYGAGTTTGEAGAATPTNVAPASYGQITPTSSTSTSSSTPNSAGLTGLGTAGPVSVGATQGQLNAGGASQGSGSLLANFNNTDLNAQLAPNMAFIEGQGTTAISNYDAAHGITGGNDQNAQTSYLANTSSGFYQQAFSNYLTQQQQNISSLSTLAGNGATTAANAAGTSAGSTIGQTTMAGVGASTGYQTSAASASAAGNVGVANAVSGAIGSGTSGLLTNQLINNSTNNNSYLNDINTANAMTTANPLPSTINQGGYVVNTPTG